MEERHALLAFAPGDQSREQVLAEVLFIADQIIVHKKNTGSRQPSLYNPSDSRAKVRVAGGGVASSF